MTESAQDAEVLSRTYIVTPFEVQAVQWTGDNAEEIRAFVGDRFNEVEAEDRRDDLDVTGALLHSANSNWVGLHTGHWVINNRGRIFSLDNEKFCDIYDRPASVLPDEGPDDGITYIEMTTGEWKAAARAQLTKLGLTYAELEAKATERVMNTAETKLWLVIKGTVEDEPVRVENPQKLVNLEATRALANAATRGPWKVSLPAGKYPQGITNDSATLIAETFVDPAFPPDDAEFIAAARTAVPSLCDEVESFYAENLRMDKEISHLRKDLTERYMQGYRAGEQLGVAKITSLENTIKFDRQHSEQYFSNQLMLEQEIRNLRSTLASAREVLARLVDTVKKLVPMPTEIQQVALSDLAANLTAFAAVHKDSYEC